MAAAKVIVAIAAVMLFAHAQCVAACSAVIRRADLSGAGPAPHCHRHSGNSTSSHNPACCSHGVTIAPVTQPDVLHFSVSVVAVGWAAQATPAVEPNRQFRAVNLFDSSPPLVNLSVTVFRV